MLIISSVECTLVNEALTLISDIKVQWSLSIADFSIADTFSRNQVSPAMAKSLHFEPHYSKHLFREPMVSAIERFHCNSGLLSPNYAIFVTFTESKYFDQNDILFYCEKCYEYIIRGTFCSNFEIFSPISELMRD